MFSEGVSGRRPQASAGDVEGRVRGPTYRHHTHVLVAGDLELSGTSLYLGEKEIGE